MYPYLHIGGVTLSMTGLGIVSFLFVFLRIAKRKASIYGVQFRALLRYMPLIIILAYLLGTWSWYFWSDFIIVSFNPKQRLAYLSPYEYHFHLTGVLAGASFGRWKFLKKQRRETHVRWRTILFESLCLATIPLGIFLLFGDNFIGNPIEYGRYISAIDPLSKVAAYDKVIPLGLYLSGGAGLLYLLITLFHKWKPDIDRAFPGLMGYRGMIAVLLLWQIYEKHFVVKFLGMTRGSKQYVCIALILFIGRQRYLLQRSSSRASRSHETDLLTSG